MTQPPPPPYAGPPPYVVPPRPQQPRPSGWWFVVGGGLLALAVTVFVAVVAWLVLGFVHVEAKVPADGRPHQVSVGTDGDRMLWHQVRDNYFETEECQVTDLETGADVLLVPEASDLNRGTWRATYRFDPGSGHLTVQCVPTGTDLLQVPTVEITQAPSAGKIVGGVLFAVAVPGLLGILGLAVLIVTGVLWATRPPRAKN